MQLQSGLALALGALISQVAAIHTVTFTNNCGEALTPTWSSGGYDIRKGDLLLPGSSSEYTFPETFSLSRFYGQDGSCDEAAGGVGCTSFHCTLPPIGRNNECFLNVADGFNVPLSFQLNAGCDQKRTCLDENCTETDRVSCNVHQFGIDLTFCPA